MKISTTTMESSMEFLKKLEIELPYNPLIPLLGTQRNVRQDTVETPAHQCSSQHYSQEPSFGNNPDTLRVMNGSRKFGIYTQWSITQPKGIMKVNE
jgi:hypothetical protein